MQLKLDALQPTVVVVLFVVVGVAVERAPPTQRAVGMGQRGPRPGLQGERGVGRHHGWGGGVKSKKVKITWLFGIAAYADVKGLPTDLGC